MKRAVLEKMTADELESLAGMLGVDTSECNGDHDALVGVLVDDSNRTETVTVAGTDFKIRIADMRDERIVDIDGKETKTFSDMREIAVCMLGEKQEKKVAEMATSNKHLDAAVYSFLVMEIAEKVQGKNS